MPSPDWVNDDVLAGDLAEAVGRPAVSDRILRDAEAAFTWLRRKRELDLELELLLLRSDSYLEDAGVRTARGPVGPDELTPRTLTFEGSGDLGVEIEVGGRGLVGQIVPPGPAEVQLMHADGLFAATTADEIGRFAFATLPSGPIRLHCAVGDRSFVTEWVPV